MGLNTYPYSPFPASTEQLHKGDNEQIQAEIDQLKSGLTDLSEEVNGDATTYPYADVITIPNAIPANLADCSVKIEPVQDLHGYDKPWVGGANTNKFNYDDFTAAMTGVTVTKNNGSMSVSGLVGRASAVVDTGFITTLPADTYTLSCVVDEVTNYQNQQTFYGVTIRKTDSSLRFVGMAINTAGLKEKSFTLEEGESISKINFNINDQNDALDSECTITAHNFMINTGSTSVSVDFVPFANICPISGHTEASVEVTDGDETTKTYTILFKDGQGNTVTLYGAEGDFNTGLFTVDRAIKEYDGSVDENWERYSIGSAGSYAMQIINTELDNHSIPSSNMLVGIPERATWGDYDGFISILSGQNPGQHKFITGIKSITTVEDWTTYLSSHTLQVCYKLATPTTIQLTPQQIQLLKGQNTLTASTGQISVTANGVSGSIGAVQEQVNATDAALAELAADIAEQLPNAPTTDGAYVLTVTVESGTPTYSWESAE